MKFLVQLSHKAVVFILLNFVIWASAKHVIGQIPSVTTTSVLPTSITATAATTGGNVTAGGSAAVTARGVAYGISQNPTIANFNVSNGSGIGTFICTLTVLASSTTYYVRAYATNSVGTAYGSQVSFTTTDAQPCVGTPTINDIDGNVYNTVQIGSQCWMRENLKVSRLRNGDTIYQHTAVPGPFLPTWCNYNNNPAYDSIYGKLYSSSVIQLGCPLGWYVPSEEWTTLTTFLGGTSVAGGKMKNTGNTLSFGGWNLPNTGATNSSGFTALPGGARDSDGGFFNLGLYGIWWSLSPFNLSTAFVRELTYDNGSALIYNFPKTDGESVRCIKDLLCNTASAASSCPSICINTSSTNITHSTTGATGINQAGVSGVNGLPPGVSATWANGTITISGTPTAADSFIYSIPLSGGCGTVNATCTNNVILNNATELTSASGTTAQTLCINAPISNITYATTTATDATVSGLPRGVTGNWSSNVFTISGTPDTSGTFIYTVTMTGGCTGGTNTATDTIIVAPAPQAPTLYLSPNTRMIFSSDTVRLHRWYKNYTVLTNDTSYVLNIDTSGTYKVQVRDSNSCWSDTRTLKVAFVSASEYVQSSIKLYPNPNTGRFFLEYEAEEEGGMQWTWFNSVAQTLGGGIIKRRGSGSQTIELELGDLPDGVHIVHVLIGQRNGWVRCVIA